MNQANTGAEQTVAGLERTATRDENAADFEFPQREAAFFYGLFLRGHHPDALRNDIRVPAEVLAKWNRECDRTPGLRPQLERVLEYRRNVLAIFETLLQHERRTQRIQ